MANEKTSLNTIEQGATVVITHRVRNGQQAEYDAWLNEIGPLCRASAGQLDCSLFGQFLLKMMFFLYAVVWILVHTGGCEDLHSCPMETISCYLVRHLPFGSCDAINHSAALAPTGASSKSTH